MPKISRSTDKWEDRHAYTDVHKSENIRIRLLGMVSSVGVKYPVNIEASNYFFQNKKHV